MTTWEWDGRTAAACAHGYRHGDCPLACRACGHRCELHAREGACTALECPCERCVDDEGDDLDPQES